MIDLISIHGERLKLEVGMEKEGNENIIAANAIATHACHEGKPRDIERH